MEKIEKDGKVAVLISPGFGAGWSTWAPNYKEILCMDADIVQAVLDGDIAKAVEIAKRKCGNFFDGGAEHLKVVWVPKGKKFEIEEYDGYERLHVIGERKYMKA